MPKKNVCCSTGSDQLQILSYEQIVIKVKRRAVFTDNNSVPKAA